MIGDIQKSVEMLFLKNRRMKDGFQYTVPSPDSYPYQWFWDSCFHAIILSRFSIEDAKKEIFSLVSHQYESGLLPHIIYWEKIPGVIDVNWGRKDTSSITQPPMIAYAVWEIYKRDKDIDFLKTIYPHLYHYYNYLLQERDPRRHHLIGIINPDESGEDNSPRFDAPLGMPPEQTIEENFKKRLEFIDNNRTCNFDAAFCMRNFFWVKDVPFNSIMVENLRLLSLIAKEAGFMEDSLRYEEEKSLIAQAMRDRMLEDGLFWSTYGMDYKKIKVKTWAIFSPMFAEVLTKDEAKILVDNYLNNPNEFASEFTVPTVSLSEPSFDPTGFWRGPIWISTNWFMYKGLMKYGFTEEAERIKQQSIELIKKNGFKEQFHPTTGNGLGAENFTWIGLILAMDKEN